MTNKFFPTGTAENGQTRIINGKKFNTADLVNEALQKASETDLDLEKAREWLAYYYHTSDEDAILRYATETEILKILDRMTGANFGGQIGKWNMGTAESIHDEMNSYLNRRIQGRRSRWGK